ncbi:MAG TPA: hypothetical protein VEL76_40325 [Gemmataceae bacterium]|nr:hypothetical protein [Gemmataceae bacterium]
MPVGARTRPTRGFQAEDSSGQAEPDLRDQELEAITMQPGSAGASLVLIEDGDGRWRPAQFWARCTRSSWRAVLAVFSRTWNSVACRT